MMDTLHARPSPADRHTTAEDGPQSGRAQGRQDESCSAGRVLDRVTGRAALRALLPGELPVLAGKTRAVAGDAAGGHLGSNLGAAEPSLAQHRVFESPRGALIFVTGHQAHVHNLLIQWQKGFDTLRQAGGLSGYPSRAESEHDWALSRLVQRDCDDVQALIAAEERPRRARRPKPILSATRGARLWRPVASAGPAALE